MRLLEAVSKIPDARREEEAVVTYRDFETTPLMAFLRPLLLKVAFFSLCLCALSSPSWAGYFELNSFYMSDSGTVSSTSTSTTSMFLDAAIMIDLDKKGYYSVGWSYTSISISQSAASTTTFSTTDMGPKFSWFINKSQNWVLAFVYNLQSTGSYSTTSSSEWRGTSLKAEFGYVAPVGETIMLGAKLNYYSASYSEQFVGSSFTAISNARSLIYPSFNFQWRY